MFVFVLQDISYVHDEKSRSKQTQRNQSSKLKHVSKRVKSLTISHTKFWIKLVIHSNLQQQPLLTTGNESGDYSYLTQSVTGEWFCWISFHNVYHQTTMHHWYWFIPQMQLWDKMILFFYRKRKDLSMPKLSACIRKTFEIFWSI